MSIPVLRSGTFRPTGSRSKHRPKSSENHTSIFLNITFLLLKKFNMAIFYSNIKWPASKNLASTLNGLKITKKKSEIFRYIVRFKQGPDPVQNCLDPQHWPIPIIFFHFFDENEWWRPVRIIHLWSSIFWQCCGSVSWNGSGWQIISQIMGNFKKSTKITRILYFKKIRTLLFSAPNNNLINSKKNCALCL